MRGTTSSSSLPTNTRRRASSGLPEIFTKRVSIPYKSEYRPVPQALHAIEYDLFGGTPAAGHAFNILLVHADLRSGLCLRALRLRQADPLFALLAALLFVVHPLHVEVVANIKGRDEILTLAFGLSAVMLLVTALERGRWLLAGAGVGCFVLACLSKTNAVTLLPLVPFVAWYRSPDSRVTRRLVISTLVIVACAVALVVGIRYLQGSVSTDLNLHLNSTVLNNVFLWTTRPETVVPTSLVNIGRYLLLFVYPYPLIHLYGLDQIPLASWTDVSTWLIIAGLVTTAIVLLRTWDRRARPVGVWRRLVRGHLLGLFQSLLLRTRHPGGSLHVHAVDRAGDRRGLRVVPSGGPRSSTGR